MGLKTPLYDTHVRLGAKLVDFGGWDLPISYGSQIEEHHAVRRDAGMFDVSHMGVVDIDGARAGEFLRRLLANDVAKLRADGRALYSCMLREDGGILDDLIAYRRAENRYRLVVNGATRRRDLAWIGEHARAFGASVVEREELAIIAVQGPNARAKTATLLAPAAAQEVLSLAPFSAAQVDGWFVARTGYTGEDGFEVMLPATQAVSAFEALLRAGVAPAGLGARDTLRLEAGMNLYGSDMDERHHPLDSGLAWTVAFDPPGRDFIGRAALERLRREPAASFVGLVLEERGVLRAHQAVFDASAAADGPGDSATPLGEITSGTFSPTLNRAIALARLRAGAPVGRAGEGRVLVDIRGRRHLARVVAPPFVRRGQALVTL